MLKKVAYAYDYMKPTQEKKTSKFPNMRLYHLEIILLIVGLASASWAGSFLSAGLETCRALVPSNIFGLGQSDDSTCTDDSPNTLFHSAADTLINNTVTRTISDLVQGSNDNATHEIRARGSFQISDCMMSEITGAQYCVYADPEFNRGRGIAIVGTPQLATRILNLPAYTDPRVLEWGRINPVYERKHYAGKGWGLMANKTIYRDELIMNTTPILLISNDLVDNFEAETYYDLQRKAVHKLPKESQDMFWQLLGQGDGDLLIQTINTNVFKATIRHPEDDGIDTRALLPENSFLNHDCRPNTHWVFDSETLSQYVFAVRTIHPGEELTLSYISLLQTRDIRQQILHMNWGFNCSCATCTGSPQQVALSDARVEIISELRRELSKFDSTTTSPVEKSELLLSLMQQERTDVLYCEAHAHAAREHNTLGHAHTALKYAYQALDSGLFFTDICSWDSEDMLNMVNRGPKNHWSWSARLSEDERRTRARAEKGDMDYFFPAERFF